jgi:hypothetical protein
LGGERAWVQQVGEKLADTFRAENMVVQTGARLSYAVGMQSYADRDGMPDFSAPSPKPYGYETDLLISEKIGSGWVPRVVVEFKLDSVTTHDALTYSSKAAAHKHIHPTLRYGMIIGGFNSIPQRIVRHGVDFDFIMTLPDATPSDENLRKVREVLQREVAASRTLESLGTKDANIWLFQRGMVVEPNR